MGSISYFVGEKKLSLSMGGAPDIIYRYLHAQYPASYTPSLLSWELGLTHEAVKKACQRLLKMGLIQRPRIARSKQRGWYQGVLSTDNLAQIEEPPVQMHNITLQIEPLKSPLTPPTPPALYIHRDVEICHGGGEGRRVIDWLWEDHTYRVSVQFNARSVTVDLRASKRPLSQEGFILFEAWLRGVLQGLGVNMAGCGMRPVKFELNKDYHLITITPSMVEIRDLEQQGWLRIYRKYRNLHRLEIGTTWEGDKELNRLFHSFGQPEAWTGSRIEEDQAASMFR